MSQATAQRAESSDVQTARSRPVATFKQGGVEVSVSETIPDKGEAYNTTIRNSYKATGWVEGNDELQPDGSGSRVPAHKPGVSGNREAQAAGPSPRLEG